MPQIRRMLHCTRFKSGQSPAATTERTLRGSLPPRDPKTRQIPPSVGSFFCLGEQRAPVRGHALPGVERVRVIVWRPTLPVMRALVRCHALPGVECVRAIVWRPTLPVTRRCVGGRVGRQTIARTGSTSGNA